MKKLTVIGDIMVEPPFMEQVLRDGACNFVPSFAPLKGILEESDYVIGNLETPLAGEEAGYTDRIVSFNSPDCLLDALKEIGVCAVSTVNNHCLDRGYAGLVRTCETLDRYGIAHTGTYPKDFKGDRIHYFTLGDTRFALSAYTYGTNPHINGVMLEEGQESCVNLIRPQDAKSFIPPLPQTYRDTMALMEELLGRKLIWEEGIKLKLSMQIPVAIVDDLVDEAEQDLWLKKVEADYTEARKNADIVLFYPHSGGQFNERSGQYTRRIVEKSAEMGFDAVFAAHSHTTQLGEYLNGKPCFYSLGNVSMSPGTFYSVSESLPEYGLAVHLYIDEKKIAKVTVSIFKMVEENGEALRVVPVDLLYRSLSDEKKEKLMADLSSVYKRVIGREHTWAEPQKEYEL